MMAEVFTPLFDKFPTLALVLLILYSFGLTCFTVYKLIYSIYFEAKKDYVAKLSSYCEHISDTVAKIATADAYPKRLISVFWEYYWGKLVLVESRELAEAMVDFGEILEKTNKKNFNSRRMMLKNSALTVSGECRDLITMTWKLSITPWKDLQQIKTVGDAKANIKLDQVP
jgi:hypothetical protein